MNEDIVIVGGRKARSPKETSHEGFGAQPSERSTSYANEELEEAELPRMKKYRNSSANGNSVTLSFGYLMGLLIVFVVLGCIIGYLIGSSSAKSRQKWERTQQLDTNQNQQSSGNKNQAPSTPKNTNTKPTQPTPPVANNNAQTKPQSPTPVEPQETVPAFKPSGPALKTNYPANERNPFREHIEEVQTFPYATLGNPKPNTSFNFTLASVDEWYHYEENIGNLIKPYVDHNCQLERLGDQHDGGYVICTNFIDSNVKAMINLGVEGRDKFGCDLTSRWSMPNLMFDCTNNRAPTCPTNQNQNKFTETCLGARKKNAKHYQIQSLKDMIDNNDLKRKHIIIKMDVQGGEYPGLRTLPVDYAEYIDQITMEFHVDGPGMKFQPEAFWGNAETLKSLQKYFVSVWVHMNSCWPPNYSLLHKRYLPAYTIEVTLVNRKLIKLNSEKRSHKEMKGPNGQNLYGIRRCQFPDDHP